MYKILKNIIEMDDYSVQKLSKSQPPEPFEWNTVEGTELNVDDCIGGKGKIEVKGNTYQKQLSGKNKFGVSERSEVVADVDCVFKDSEILINGAQTTGRSTSKLTFKDILPAGTYHIKPKVISGTCVNGSGGHALSIVITDTNNTKLVDKWLDALDMDFTLSEETQLNFSIWIPAGAQFNNYKVGIQIEEGSTATDYEPYCGGQPSPNPDYPQEIKVVTGNNVIRHIGKNLLDLSNGISNHGITTTLKDDGSVDLKGTTDSEWFNMTVSSGKRTKIRLLPGKYTFSVNEALNFSLRIKAFYKNYPAEYFHITINPGKTSGTFTVPRECDNFYVYAYGLTTGTVIDLNIKLQLEEGSTPTQYEPYRGEDYKLNLGSIELCKIGDYEDIPFKNVAGDENYNAELENGAWYKKGVIDKIAGSDNFATNGIDTNKIDFLTPVLNVEGNLQANTFSQMCCCNLLQTVMTNHTGINGTTSSKEIRISVSKEYASTYDEAKQLLADIVIYYIQETPTYTKITDPTLISQLEALRKAKWFKGVNHCWTETDNLEPVLAGTYKQSIQSETQNSIANLQVQANEQSISNTPESEV